jgi:gamma-aminobutyric acid type B receptor
MMLSVAVLMTSNSIGCAITMDPLDPLHYLQKDANRTNPWNRVISTRGTCIDDNLLPYTMVLALLNVGMLLTANHQAYCDWAHHTKQVF